MLKCISFTLSSTHTREKTRLGVKDMTQTLDSSRVLADFACSTASMIEKYRTKLQRSLKMARRLHVCFGKGIVRGQN